MLLDSGSALLTWNDERVAFVIPVQVGIHGVSVGSFLSVPIFCDLIEIT